MFFGQILHSHSASLHPGTGQRSGKPDEKLGGYLAMDKHAIQGKIERCFGNRDKLRIGSGEG